MVSVLYRTHKSLQNAFKISSLYVFDALARAAKSKVVKQGLSADVSNQSGNPATFLSKLGGVVEGLFRDMVTSDIPESKVRACLQCQRRWTDLFLFFVAAILCCCDFSDFGASLLSNTLWRLSLVSCGAFVSHQHLWVLTRLCRRKRKRSWISG